MQLKATRKFPRLARESARPNVLRYHDLQTGNLVRLLADHEWLIAPGPERAIWGVYPPKKVVSPKVRTFLAFLEQRFGNPPYWEAMSAP